MFDHFLITRFNLKKTDWGRDKNNQKVLDEKWLHDRIGLFEKYCLPSVLGQSCLNFRWLIFFEKDSESDVSNLLEKLKKFTFIEAFLLNGYQEFQNGLPGFIRNRCDKDSDFVITTRLDNDDALNSEFIAELQRAFKESLHDQILHFPNGLVLDTGKNHRLGSVYYPLNQFISLVENTQKKEFKTVFAREHDKWGDSYSLQDLELKDAWLQVTHSNNMVNSFKGSPAYSRRLASFNISEIKFEWDYNLLILSRAFKERIKQFLSPAK